MQSDVTNPALVDYPKAAFNAFLMMRFSDTTVNLDIVAGVPHSRSTRSAYSERTSIHMPRLCGRMFGSIWMHATLESPCSNRPRPMTSIRM
jgi:hypothetical protein